jgi:hypothetical protein
MPGKRSHHVGGSKVAHHELVLPGLDDLGNLVRNGLDAHLRLLVVGSNLGRRNHDALLARVLLLDTAVEEESDVRVLLRLWRLATILSSNTHPQCGSA